MDTGKRTYRKKRRAESMAETRRRIVEAAIALHQQRGVAATSMRDVAAEAGVGVVTVYRHFPDEQTLTGACSGTYFERHPFPDVESWTDLADPVARLRLALTQVYAYHRETAPMLASVLPEVRGTPLVAPYDAHWSQAAELLLAAWPDSARRDGTLAAGIALALRFETWQLLTGGHGLSDAQAADLMLRLAGKG